MPTTKKSSPTRAAPAKKTASSKTKAKSKVKKVMHEYKEGELHSGSKKGPKVKSRKQAIAIALHEAGISRDQIGAKKKSSRSTRRKKTQSQ